MSRKPAPATAHHLAVALASLRAPKLGPERVREIAVVASLASKAAREAHPARARAAALQGWETRRRRAAGKSR